MHCLNRPHAVSRVQDIQVGTLSAIASAESAQQHLEAAADWLDEEDAEHVRDAAKALRRAVSELRDAEALLSDINTAMRARTAALR
jgi:Mg2+ and Co2+ transporter CorA